MEAQSAQSTTDAGTTAAPQQPRVTKRDGAIAEFDERRIKRAIEKAFRADLEIADNKPLEAGLEKQIELISLDVVGEVFEPAMQTGVDVEYIQDVVEKKIMLYGHYSVARRYILYRAERAKARLLRGETDGAGREKPEFNIVLADGTIAPLHWERVIDTIEEACAGLRETDPNALIEEVSRSVYNNIPEADLDRATVLAARTRIEHDPEYSIVAARLLLNIAYREVFGEDMSLEEFQQTHAPNFSKYIHNGIESELLSKDLLRFDLDTLAMALKPERDLDFLYLGVQTIYDRYLLHVNKRRIEVPQYMFMRVAMGLALNEGPQKEQRAIEFYNTLSTFRFVSSTPTLFNSGTLHPQLSSCYLSTIGDDLNHIFKVVADNAKLSKWAGGIGNDWTGVRATGAKIKGTNGESQGVIPFLKVANDTAVAVNQGGKRKGAVCAYLETWHLEIEEFLELRKNTGDDRRRTHDMNTANWIPDLFLKRVAEGGTWTLFSPDEVPDLHETYGKDFEKRYVEYEHKAANGDIRLFKQIPALQLWRKMLSMLFETGHPWITFKDPSNIRSPQDHAGVVHNSNLCTEILLNTSEDETAVCNLGSVNLAAHTTSRGIDKRLLQKTIQTAVRMLDNVIDINFYPTEEARNSNLRHRPVGLGIMGFQDALYAQRIGYASHDAVEFADESMELISYFAILASIDLARERGAYGSYEGSKWSRGLLPIDTLGLLEQERGSEFFLVDTSSKQDWDLVRSELAKHGIRNSNVMAIAPTATIANISGVTQSIEPTYRNLFVKSNLSGDFTVVNPHLVQDLKNLRLWDQEMIDDLKYFDGSIQSIERVPEDLKRLYVTSFEVEPQWLIECASRRQKWIDMGQSLNLYIKSTSGKLLSNMYMLAWKKGLKTTYYLRSLGATQVEKSSIDINKRGIQPRWMKSKSASSSVALDREEVQPQAAFCDPTDPDCEACQ